METNMAGYGQKLREHRIAKEITLLVLSQRTDLDSDYLSKIERGVVPEPTEQGILTTINSALELTSSESKEMDSLAHLKVTAHRSSSEHIPAFFRTADNENLTETKIRELHKYLNSGI